MTRRQDEILNLVAHADRVGMTPTEWLEVCTPPPTPEPPTAEEWREAILSTVSESR